MVWGVLELTVAHRPALGQTIYKASGARLSREVVSQIRDMMVLKAEVMRRSVGGSTTGNAIAIQSFGCR